MALFSSRLTRDARDLVSRQVAARCEAPRATHERANAEAERLVIREALYPTFTRVDRLHAIATDADIRVLRARTACRVERDHRELAVRCVTCGGSGGSGSGGGTRRARGGLLRTDAGVYADRRCCR